MVFHLCPYVGAVLRFNCLLIEERTSSQRFTMGNNSLLQVSERRRPADSSGAKGPYKVFNKLYTQNTSLLQ